VCGRVTERISIQPRSQITTMPLPSISIVVPNFNGAKTLRGTLDSLLEQAYPELEILVVDGGSTDDSVAIIREYEPYLAWWISEKDRGQSDALNKGFARATGEVVNWLCSDDLLLPGALAKVGGLFAEDPSIDAVVGATEFRFLTDGRVERQTPNAAHFRLLPIFCPFAQPSGFFRRRLFEEVGRLDDSLHYTMDLDLWTRFQRRGCRWKVIPDVLSVAQMTGDNKMSTCGPKFVKESERIYRRYVNEPISLMFWQRLIRHPLERWRHRSNGTSLDWRLIGRPLQILSLLALGPFYGFDRVRYLNWGNWI
jgi:GT2 family glycosyltransferase